MMSKSGFRFSGHIMPDLSNSITFMRFDRFDQSTS